MAKKIKTQKSVKAQLKKNMILSAAATLIVSGGSKVMGNNPSDDNLDPDIQPVNREYVAQQRDTSKEISILKDLKISPTDDFKSFVEQCRPLTPYLIGWMVCPEGYESNPYQDSRGIWTIGYGSTMTKSGRVTPKTRPVSIDGAYELSRWHIEDYETYFLMYCYMCEFNKTVNAGEFLGLNSFLYNGAVGMMEPESNGDAVMKKHRNARWGELRQIYKDTGNITRDQVHDLFKKYPLELDGSVLHAWRTGKSKKEVGNQMAKYIKAGGRVAPGLKWRRWMEACLISGDMNPMDILNCPIGSVNAFRKYYIGITGHDLIDDGKINYDAAREFKKWVKHPCTWDAKRGQAVAYAQNIKLVKDVIPADIVAFCEYGKISVNSEIIDFALAAQNLRASQVRDSKTGFIVAKQKLDKQLKERQPKNVNVSGRNSGGHEV